MINKASIVIKASNLSLRRGTKSLLENTDFTIHPSERVGIIGKNGAGKSTLFALFNGQLEPSTGDLQMPDRWRLSNVEQEISDRDRPAREFVMDGDAQLRQLQTQRAACSDSDGERIAELEAALIDADAWTAVSRAEQLLAGLGFAPHEWMRPVGEFSGGWQMRIALARALMAPSDLLLLDEPTNHLDLDAMLWLERWLKSYAGTVLIISHDTEFLDAVANAILHFDQQKLERYSGGYDQFVQQRAEKLRQHQLAHDKQSRETARLQGFIDRFKAKATKAKQAQSRVKALARMQRLSPIRQENPINIQLPNPEHQPDPLIRLDHAVLGYAGEPEPRVIFNDLKLTLRGGARIGVLGVNGAGKSTLIKTLAGTLPLLGGECTQSNRLGIGYFAQHQLEVIDAEASPLVHLQRIAPGATDQQLRNYLGSFGFSGPMATDPTAGFSGGEKARLALALIVWHKPNLLLLDEPTNHLDMETRDALSEALVEYEGSVLIVSHDRQLLRTTVDEFWIVADGQVHEFEGDLDDYRQWLQQRSASNAPPHLDTTPTSASNSETDGVQTAATDRRAQRRAEAEARQRLSVLKRPLEKQLAQLETNMASTQSRLDELNDLIADPDFYTDAYKNQRPSCLAEQGELSQRFLSMEENWLELQQQIEDLENRELGNA